MDKKILGQVFKRLRISKGFKQKDILSDGVSKSTISSFELGETDIQLSKFYKLVKKIGVSLEEFDYAVNGYDFSDFDKLMNRIGVLYDQQNVVGLKLLLSSEIERYKTSLPDIHHKINCAMIKCLIAELDENFEIANTEKNQITDYLYRSENWSYHQLVLYNNTIRILDTSALVYYSDLAISRTAYYRSLPINKRLTREMLLNTMIVLTDKKEFILALKFKSHFENLVGERDLFEKTVFLYLTGAIDFGLGKEEQGRKKMQQAIDIFRVLRSDSFATSFQKDYYEITDEKS